MRFQGWKVAVWPNEATTRYPFDNVTTSSQAHVPRGCQAQCRLLAVLDPKFSYSPAFGYQTLQDRPLSRFCGRCATVALPSKSSRPFQWAQCRYYWIISVIWAAATSWKTHISWNIVIALSLPMARKISEVSGITDSWRLADTKGNYWIEIEIEIEQWRPSWAWASEIWIWWYPSTSELSAISSRSRVKIGSRIDFATQRPLANCCGPWHHFSSFLTEE